MVNVIDAKFVRAQQDERYDFVHSSLEDLSFDLGLNSKSPLSTSISSYGEMRGNMRPLQFEIDVGTHVFSVYKESCYKPILQLAEEYESRFGVHATLNKDFTW